MNAADAAAKNATSTATTPSVAGGTTPAPSAAPAAAINATVYTAPAGVLVSPRPKPAISENEANGAEKQSKVSGLLADVKLNDAEKMAEFDKLLLADTGVA
jgi:hypothetical protein